MPSVSVSLLVRRLSMISVTNKSHKGDISESGKQSTFRNKNSAIVVIRVILVEIIQKNHVHGPHGQRGGHPLWGPSGSRTCSLRSKL